jgi:hypothetical protein
LLDGAVRGGANDIVRSHELLIHIVLPRIELIQVTTAAQREMISPSPLKVGGMTIKLF